MFQSIGSGDRFITKGHKRGLEEELYDLTNNKIPEAKLSLKAAKDHGDLSENEEAECESNKLSRYNERKAAIIDILDNCVAISASDIVNKSVVQFGCKVTVIKKPSAEEKSYQIVGISEIDIKKNKISYKSLFAQAIINKTVGDQIELNNTKYEIKKIEYDTD